LSDVIGALTSSWRPPVIIISDGSRTFERERGRRQCACQARLTLSQMHIMNYTRFIREKGTYNEENIMKP